MGAVISRVEPRSVAQKYGFRENDEIITINGQLLRDIIDYHFLTTEHKLEINYVRDGLPHSTVIHKEESDVLGLDFTEEIFDGVTLCRNKCIFCFVDQLPGGMRKTLYLKDDDYRLSFLHGNYITLTNLAENDLRRITAQRLSPLYVSVHATDPEVREKMMGTPNSGNILKYLNKLKQHNIQCHTQIVIVPGLNDGKVLKKTLQDLYNLFPIVKTVAIVPVGLTKYGKASKQIRTLRNTEAKQICELVSKFQNKASKFFKYPFFYLSDEFYLLMNEDFPRHAHFGFFEQIGNGVGLSRKFITDFNRRKRFFPASLKETRNVWIVTGILGEKVLKPLVSEFSKIKRLKVRLVPVKNDFFGHTVTVTGLLTGQDIQKTLEYQLKRGKKPDIIIFPDVLLYKGAFLDDMTPEEISRKLQVPFQAVPTDAMGLIEATLGIPKRASCHEKGMELELKENEPIVLEEKASKMNNGDSAHNRHCKAENPIRKLAYSGRIK